MSALVKANSKKNNEIDFLDLLKQLEDMEHKYKNDVFPKFNVFRSAKLVKHEIRHSNILAFLLSPNESHGLGDALLKRFVIIASTVSSHINNKDRLRMALATFDDARVFREAPFTIVDASNAQVARSGESNKNFIDILVHSDSNKIVMVIENKLGSRERDNQLKTYHDHVKGDTRYNGFTKLYVYLTVDDDPSESDSDIWASIHYDFIKENLFEIYERKKTTIGDDVGLFITHYLDLISRNIMREVDPKFVEACEAVYANHKAILDQIIQIRTTANSRFVSEFIKVNKGIIQLGQSNKRFTFITEELKQLMAEKNMKSVGSWQGDSIPIALTYKFTEEKITLIVRVGPMGDQAKDKRDKLVRILKPKIKTFNDNKTIVKSVSAVYDDEDNEFAILEAMNSLYKKLNDAYLKALAKSIRDVWGKKS